MSEIQRESGQSQLVAMCFALPIFFIVIAFFVQVCWVGYQSLCLDHALYQTAWSIDQEALDKMDTISDTNTYIHDAIVSDWTQIDGADLAISNARCKVVSNVNTHTLTSTNDLTGLLIERITQTTTSACITANVVLHVKLLVPIVGVEQIDLVRTIDKTQQISGRLEVS